MKKKTTAQYLTLNINPTLLVFNIETPGKLIDVPEKQNTQTTHVTTITNNTNQ